MILKTMRPTYQGANTDDRLSMLIAYTEELGEELAFRIESLAKEIANLKSTLYGGGDATNEST